MTERIFKTLAPTYWAAGLPVIPLRRRNKMPDISQWSVYGSRMPDELEQRHWLASFPNGNIGLPLGPASGICMIDIDTDQEDLIDAIREICGPSPWVRIGKKGMALAYRFEQQKNFKLRAADGGMLCEFLGQGNQVVLPGSIHPDTGLPYTSNTNLWEVKDQLTFLGEDIEDKMRALLGQRGYELGAGGRSAPLDVIPAGERDVQMVRHAGYLARVVLGIDRSASFSLWEAIMHMHTWVEHFTTKVSGDAMDPNKGVAKLLEFLVKDVEGGRTMPTGWDAGLPDEWLEHPTIAKLTEVNADKSWTFARAEAWFSQNVLSTNSQDVLLEGIVRIIDLLAADPNFSTAHEIEFFSWVKDRSGKLAMTVRDMRAMLSRARKAAADDRADNHGLVGRIVLEQLQRAGEIRYDHGQFWQWNGSCFSPLDQDLIYIHVANNITDSVLVRRNSDYKAIVQVLERMCKAALVQVKEGGINFANGYLLPTLELVEHDPKYGATFTLPFEYHPEQANDCTRWFEFLSSCWGAEPDFEQRVTALQEMFAATLFGVALDYQQAFLLFGRSGTGKTQVLNVLRKMLPPDAVSALGPHDWGAQFALTSLIGKCANICGELPENGAVPGNVLKEVVEGTPQLTEFKGKDKFSFTPVCAHWFASNYLPMSPDSSRGFVRRWVILDFNRTVPKCEVIENLAELIVAEGREAIAAWAVAGLPRLRQQKGYTLPTCHHERIGQVRRINNTVQAFIEDSPGYVRGEVSMKVRDLYTAYVVYMKEILGSKPVRPDRFAFMLEDLDFDVRRNTIGDYVVFGIGPAPAGVVPLRAVAR